MLLAKQGIIPEEKYYHDPEIQNKKGNTVALLLASNGIIPPNQWKHNPKLQNKHGQTVAMELAQEKIIPPKSWRYSSCLQNEEGLTVAMCIVFYCEKVPDITWHHEPSIKNNRGWTVAMMIAYYLRISPPKLWYHDPALKDDNGQTVAMKLAQQGVIPSKIWQYNKFTKSNAKYTVARTFAYHKTIPSQHWMITKDEDEQQFDYIKKELQSNHLPVPLHVKDEELTIFDQACYRMVPDIAGHKSDEQNEDGFTVAMILVINGMEIPERWHHDPNIQNKYDVTVAMLMIYCCKDINQLKIPQQWVHNPELTDFGNTVAMRYFQRHVIPPKEWNHDKFKTNYSGKNIAYSLALDKIIPPQDWMVTEEENKDIFNSISSILQFNDLPTPLHIKNNELTIFDQACYRIIPNIAGHQPDERDKDGFTVAMILAINNIQIPKEWCHDKYLRCKCRKQQTVQNILLNRGSEVPEEWKYGFVIDRFDMTQAMKQAKKGQIPDKQYYHKPDFSDISGYTVAMYLAQERIIPPRQWEHDKFMKNNEFINNTVAEILSSRGIIPPQQWMITKDEDEQIFKQICKNLEKCCYTYVDGQFIFNVKTIAENNVCQICLNDGEQQFIEAKCNHKVCLQCFRQIIQQKQQNSSCPICRQKDWYQNLKENDQISSSSSYGQEYESDDSSS